VLSGDLRDHGGHDRTNSVDTFLIRNEVRMVDLLAEMSFDISFFVNASLGLDEEVVDSLSVLDVLLFLCVHLSLNLLNAFFNFFLLFLGCSLLGGFGFLLGKHLLSAEFSFLLPLSVNCTCVSELLKLFHDGLVWEESVHVHSLFEFTVIYVECSIFLEVVGNKGVKECLFGWDSLSFLLSILGVFEFNDFSVTEWNSEYCAVSNWCVLC
jgi:hypothetical protein